MRCHVAALSGAVGAVSIFGCRMILISDELLEIQSMTEGVGSGLRVAKVAWSILCM